MKKEKASQDIFDMQCWHGKIVTDPYRVVAEVFGHADMKHFRNVVRKLLCYAVAEKVYKDKSPGDVILNMKIIRSLIKAAHSLKEKKCSPVEINGEDVFDKKYFRSHYRSSDDWKDFPRCLSKKEYYNPYLVFKKFFKYQVLEKWVKEWENIVEWALLCDSQMLPVSELVLYSHLAKLVEAAHLVDVREVTHVDGHLKNRFLQ